MKAIKIVSILVCLLVVPLVAVNAEDVSFINRATAKSHVVLGFSYLKLDDQVKAATEFEKALKIDPTIEFKRAEMGQFYYDLGMIYLMNYELDGSLPFFAKAARLDTENPKPVTAMALVYSLKAEDALENGDNILAQEYYAKCIALKPDFGLDNIFACLTEYSIPMDKVDQIAADFAATYCAIAREYVKENQFDQAVKYYGIALELVPTSKAAQKGLLEIAKRNLNDNNLIVVN